MYFDRQGRPITMRQWAAMHPNDEAAFERQRRVAITEWADVRVSTVWLGLNHAYGDTPPLIFETMVFAPGREGDEECWRYSTEEQALAGHYRVVAEWRERVP